MNLHPTDDTSKTNHCSTAIHFSLFALSLDWDETKLSLLFSQAFSPPLLPATHLLSSASLPHFSTFLRLPKLKCQILDLAFMLLLVANSIRFFRFCNCPFSLDTLHSVLSSLSSVSISCGIPPLNMSFVCKLDSLVHFYLIFTLLPICLKPGALTSLLAIHLLNIFLLLHLSDFDFSYFFIRKTDFRGFSVFYWHVTVSVNRRHVTIVFWMKKKEKMIFVPSPK